MMRALRLHLRALLEFFIRDTKIALSYRLSAVLQIAAMFSLAVTFFFLSLMMKSVEGNIPSLARYGGSYFAFSLVGLAVSLYIEASLRSFSISVRTAQMTGTFEAMLVTRTPIGVVVLGSALYSLTYTGLRSAILLAMGAGVFGMPLYLHEWPTLLLVVGLTVVATMALGIFSAGFIVLFKQGDPLTAAISGLSWLLSGVLYPKEILPLPVQALARLLPMTHTLEALRQLLLLGAPPSAIEGSIAGLAIFGAVGLPLSLAWFAWSVGRARIAGSLARY
ncbi:MAG: ABC transporter permease [Myxococcota bacterium]